MACFGKALWRYLLALILGLALIGSATPARACAPMLLAQASDSPRGFVSAAVDRVGDAVVRIDVEKSVSFGNPFGPQPFFRRFFGDEVPFGPSGGQLRGQGSGVIVESNGIVLTNAHVVSQADRVTVVMKDGRSYPGEVRGADPVTDLAVVEIDGRNLPTAPLGNSDEVRVGDWAIAVGNPLGLDNTVTLGIVSTLNRPSVKVGIPDKRIDFIQTDAAINPGNSGGPLLNDRGEVIGINTAIRADANGIGFAIPSKQVKGIYPRLARGERIAHPYLGVRLLTLTPALAKENNRDPRSSVELPEIEGALIVQVQSNAPADDAGLRGGDIVTEVNGQRVTSAEQLQDIVENSAGNQLVATIQRGNRQESLTIRPGDLQDFS